MNGSDRREAFNEFLEMRGVDPDDPCPDCSGLGVKTYGDTSTWRHGVGGQSFTNAVCDKCWGSGDSRRPWPSHRVMERLARETNR